MRIQLPSGVKVEVIMNMRIPIIDFLLPGQKFISIPLSHILTTGAWGMNFVSSSPPFFVQKY
jgi:hypothetical protein